MDETSCRVDKAFVCLTALVQLPCPPYRQITALYWDVIGKQPYPVILNLDRLDLQPGNIDRITTKMLLAKKPHQSMKDPDLAGIDGKATCQPNKGLAGSQDVPLARRLQTLDMKLVRWATCFGWR
ncbi:uncharacterized protein N7446_000497 [Penicillium canescens]|uniref:Uncharacterized protein n=1 Tax=Penicillium canescens TaxID=5083 RepID=A0AAD6I433_PENCN|nr:uncharacterized protein N7446_000497 [Penicillium canescens]KAJ6030440.1 hypothetical protein N7460_010706 [Penicillium canescens]KAJ6060815.1 hypothetical protein N7444_002669 [Penicillium canescens]KAJ6077561.1 hypothetical protein N7446_000497 [Penicillium canescens]